MTATAGLNPVNVADSIAVEASASGIIEVTLSPNQQITAAQAQEAGAAVRTLAAGRRVPLMLVITGVLGVCSDARSVYTESSVVSAFALVGESPVDRVFGHYLLRAKTDAVPAKFFTSKSAAVEWLGLYSNDD